MSVQIDDKAVQGNAQGGAEKEMFCILCRIVTSC